MNPLDPYMRQVVQSLRQYPIATIQEALNNALGIPVTKKSPYALYVPLLIGLTAITLFLGCIALGAMLLFESFIWGPLLILLTGLALNTYTNYLKSHLGADEKFSLMMGLLAPLPTGIVIQSMLTVVSKLIAQASMIISQEGGGYQMGLLTSLFNPNLPPPLLMVFLLYLSANLSNIALTIRNKRSEDIIAYAIGVGLYAIAWSGVSLILNNIIVGASS